MKKIFLLSLVSLALSSPSVFARCYKRAGAPVLSNLAIGTRPPLVEVKCNVVIDNLVLPGGPTYEQRVCGVAVHEITDQIPDSEYAAIVRSIKQPDQADQPDKIILCRDRRRGYRAVVAIYADGEAHGYLFNK